MNFRLLSLLLLANRYLPIANAQSSFVDYFPDEPELQWTKILGSKTDAGPGNGIHVSPSGIVFVTAKDGTLSAFTAEKGKNKGYYTPSIKEEGWTIECTSGISMNGDTLVYAIVDVPPITSLARKESRVIAISTKDIATQDISSPLWISDPLEGDVGFGTPQIDDNDGSIVYITRTSYPQPPPPTTVPSASPSSGPTSAPSSMPSFLPTNLPSEIPSSVPSLAPTTAAPTTAAPTSSTPTVTPLGTPVDTTSTRHLQQQTEEEIVGYFTILNAKDGSITLDEPNPTQLRNHEYGPVGIARNVNPGGRYEGGAGNTNDVLVWGSLRVADPTADFGERLLYQWATDSSTDSGKVVVLENTDYTTLGAPTLTANGQSLFMLLRGGKETKNIVRGWVDNDFDLTHDKEYVMQDASEPFTHGAILAKQDSHLLMGSGTSTAIALNASTLEEIWKEPTDGVMTTAMIASPDQERLYVVVGKELVVKSIADGSTIYKYPLKGDSGVVADLAVSPDGLYVYYTSENAEVRGLKVGEQLGSHFPSASPSMPAPSGSSMPSASPSVEPTPAPTIPAATPNTEVPVTSAPTMEEESMATTTLIIIIACSAVGGILFMGIVLFFLRRKKRSPRGATDENFAPPQRDYPPSGGRGGGYGENDDEEKPPTAAPVRRKHPQQQNATTNATDAAAEAQRKADAEQKIQQNASFQEAQQRRAAEQQRVVYQQQQQQAYQQQQQAAYLQQQQAYQQQRAQAVAPPPPQAFQQQQQQQPYNPSSGQPHWATQ